MDRRGFVAGASALALVAADPARAAITLTGAGAPGAGPVTDANVLAVNDVVSNGTTLATGGWTATWNGTPQFVVVNRQGFDTSGAATTYANEKIVITKRLRQNYPAQASLDASVVALSDYIYSTDAIVGSAANNSLLTSPQPICQWVIPDRQTVGNSLKAEIVAFHVNARNFEQVACVLFTASDGSNTVTAKVSTSTISTETTDKVPVIVYAATLDIISLNAGQITLDAKVYPWIGGNAAIADTSGVTAGTRAFCRQIYYKDTTKFATPYFAYVSSTGADAAGTSSNVSQAAATAAANPFLTIAGALAGARTVLTDISGLHIRIVNTVATGTPALVTAAAGEVVIEADPNASAGVPVISLAATTNFLAPYLRIQNNITITKTASSQMRVGNALTLYNVTFNDATNSALLSNNGIYARLQGVTFSAMTAGLLNPLANSQYRLVRGCTATSATSVAIDSCCAVGNTFTGVFGLGTNTLNESGMIVAYNKLMNLSQTAGALLYGQIAGTCSGSAVVQNVFETTQGTSNRIFGPSSDTGLSTLLHAVIHHNTFAGYLDNGRCNMLYNSTAATNRPHNLTSVKGNIHSQINHKGDFFATTATLTQTPYLYGVSCVGECATYRNANGLQNGANGQTDSFSQMFVGLGNFSSPNATMGTAATPLTMNFTTNKQFSPGGDGLGGGNYQIAAGSAAQGVVPAPTLRFDMAGAARKANGSAGAYEL